MVMKKMYRRVITIYDSNDEKEALVDKVVLVHEPWLETRRQHGLSPEMEKSNEK